MYNAYKYVKHIYLINEINEISLIVCKTVKVLDKGPSVAYIIRKLKQQTDFTKGTQS